MLNHKKYLISAGTLLLLTLTLSAQAPPAQKGTGIPDGGTREMLVSIFIPSLPNRPFTATVNTEWVRFLGDGTRITLVNHRLIARDKAGRIFQERRLLVPETGGPESVVTQTEITDPVAQEKYICMPHEHVCQVEVFQALASDGPRSKRIESPGDVDLGTKMIAGVEAIGTRQTTVIPQGQIGNNSPILTKMEYWYSPQLGFNTLSIREDPRFGTQRFELTGVVIGDPESSLFTPPAGSKIYDLRSPSVVGKPESAAPEGK